MVPVDGESTICRPCRGKMTGWRRCGLIWRNFSTVVIMGRVVVVEPWMAGMPTLGLSLPGSFSFSRYLQSDCFVCL